MRLLQRILLIIDRINIGAGVALALCMTMMVIYQILSRYLPIWSAPWSEEAARFMWIWVIGLIAGPAYKRSSYVGIDLVPGMLGPQKLLWLRRGLHLIAAIFAAVLMVKGWELAVRTTNQVSPALGMNMGLINGAFSYVGLNILLASIEALAFPTNPDCDPAPYVPVKESEL